jgi:penicillin-binding protein 1A
MKLCYADPELKVSKEEFERPANLSIKSRLFCSKAKGYYCRSNTDEFEF